MPVPISSNSQNRPMHARLCCYKKTGIFSWPLTVAIILLLRCLPWSESFHVGTSPHSQQSVIGVASSNRGPSRTTSCRTRRSSSSILLSSSSTSNRSNKEDLYAAVHRKEYEMKQVNQQHRSTTDPVRMAMGYAEESSGTRMRLAKALRRVYDDPHNPANPQAYLAAQKIKRV